MIEYTRHHGAWNLHLEPRGKYEPIESPADWQGEGIIGRVIDPKQAEQLRRLTVPVINTATMPAGLEFPTVTANEYLIGKMAAEHLLENRFERFAYFPPTNRPNYNDEMKRGFLRTMYLANYPCDVLAHSGHDDSSAATTNREALVTWLKHCPKPVALLAWNAGLARGITEACLACEVLVPEEVAVIAGEFDELACSTSFPELSYVASPTVEIGFRAAAALDHMMEGGAALESTFLPPVELVVSGSSNAEAINDPIVRNALHMIRAGAPRKITAADVAAELNVSKRFLEKRFEAELGGGPASELRSWRMQIAKNLLRLTGLRICEIAERAGYLNAQSFSRAFRESAHMTPQMYRAKYRR